MREHPLAEHGYNTSRDLARMIQMQNMELDRMLNQVAEMQRNMREILDENNQEHLEMARRNEENNQRLLIELVQNLAFRDGLNQGIIREERAQNAQGEMEEENDNEARGVGEAAIGDAEAEAEDNQQRDNSNELNGVEEDEGDQEMTGDD